MLGLASAYAHWSSSRVDNYARKMWRNSLPWMNWNPASKDATTTLRRRQALEQTYIPFRVPPHEIVFSPSLARILTGQVKLLEGLKLDLGILGSLTRGFILISIKPLIIKPGFFYIGILKPNNL